MVLYSEYLNLEALTNSFCKASFLRLPQINFQIQKVRSLEAIREYRKKINEINSLISSLEIKNYDVLIIFTDKDFFNQILIKSLLSWQQLIAIDEGIGFYVKDKLFDGLLNFLYRIFTKKIFGFSFEYIRCLGATKRIDLVFLRLPDMVQSRHIKILPFVYKVDRIVYHSDSKKILILTSPMVEDFLMTPKRYGNDLTNLINFWTRRGFQIVLKRHPREKVPFNYDVEFLDHSETIESMELSDYQYIVNFMSSSIIDVLSRGFPCSKVVTINIANFPIKLPLFEKTLYYSNVREFINDQDIKLL